MDIIQSKYAVVTVKTNTCMYGHVLHIHEY